MLVRLRSGLHIVAPGADEWHRVELGERKTTVRRVLEDLHIPAAAVWVILVNGEVAGAGSEVGDGDCVEVFPPVDGG